MDKKIPSFDIISSNSSFSRDPFLFLSNVYKGDEVTEVGEKEAKPIDSYLEYILKLN